MLSGLKRWFSALSLLGKTGVIASLVAFGAVASASSSPQSSPPTNTQKVQSADTKQPDCDLTRTTSTETDQIPFNKTTVNDPNTAQGKTYVKTAGVNGVKTLTYSVGTYTPSGCKNNTKELVKEEVTKPAVTEVTAIGTYVAPKSNCDPNYSGGCVPIASDVDCGGGSGNGPAYFYGTATVVGTDIYGLDRDGDGIACE